MVSFLLRMSGNILAIYTAAYLMPGFVFNGGLKEYAIAGVFLGLLNVIVKPIVKMISMPLIILTLGLFTLVINALILWTVDYIFDFITIVDVLALIWATITIVAVNIIISGITKMLD